MPQLSPILFSLFDRDVRKVFIGCIAIERLPVVGDGFRINFSDSADGLKVIIPIHIAYGKLV
jgi:hypothetical protein